MRASEADWSVISSAIERSHVHFEKTRLIFVANTKTGSPPTFDYPYHSILTDFFSDQEYSDLLTGFRKCAGYVEGVVGEEAFLRRLAIDDLMTFPGRTIIYAGPGNSPGRASNLAVPTICEFRNLTTCCADPYALALTENKFHSFRLLRDAGIPTVEDWLFDPILGWARDLRPDAGLKVIAKPVNGCASIGITTESIGEFGPQMEEFIRAIAISFGEAFIVQRFVPGFEVEVPIFGLDHVVAPMACGIALAGKHNLGDQVLSYDAVFDDAYNFYNFDEVDTQLSNKCRDIAVRAYRILTLSGIARIDFRIDEDGNPYTIDVSNVPHLTPHGSSSFAFEACRYAYSDLLSVLLSIGHDRIDRSDVCPNLNWSIER